MGLGILLLMRSSLLRIVFTLTISAAFFSCDNKKDEFALDAPADYAALQPGKFIIYRLDSLVFVQAGRAEEIHSYQEKHLIEAQITDNLGRTAYRVFRSIRDVAGTLPWQPSGTYAIVPTNGTLEVIEDNLRVLKLTAPLAIDHTWRGNRYLADEPYGSMYSFSNDDNMQSWDFVIDKKEETLTLNGKTYTDVLTVTAIEDSLNVPIRDAASYASRSIYKEKYAKGVGLIFQDYALWEYQPNTNGTPYKIGFGVKRTILDHN